MKTIPFLAFFLVLLAISTRGQINISPDGSTAHQTAMLEVKSTDRGFLPPRVTGAQRDAIAMPAEGLIVICTDCRAGDSAAISVFLNGSWKVLGGYCRTPAIPAPGSSMAGTTQITWAWLAVPGARGYR
ncbi:MAG TPA: hypothetical protein PLK82_05640, partial [Bacteroidales bacterium]|nr:hypothetical protein [Bacteroidales bacterium]